MRIKRLHGYRKQLLQYIDQLVIVRKVSNLLIYRL